MIIDARSLMYVCIAAVAALVWAEFHNRNIARAIFKIIASAAFVLVALLSGATDSRYGHLILTALILSFTGDVLLLSTRDRIFLLGISFFLMAHIAFSAAFAQLPIDVFGLAIGFVTMAFIGIAVLRWLWHHLSPFYRIAVTAYVAAIVAMCSLAISISTAPGACPIAVGAIAFAASDISVARDRFVSPSFTNRFWGLPLYYAAQLVMAFSVRGH